MANAANGESVAAMLNTSNTMRILLCFLLLAAGLFAYLSVFTVDQTEFVYVTQFGRHVRTYDGATDGGLHFRWPWPIQSVQRLDRRLQYFDLPGAEVLTHDPRGKTIDKTLAVNAYVCWRIAPEMESDRGVDQFIKTVGTPERARLILGQRVTSRLGAEIGKMEMDDLVSVEPNKVEHGMKQLRDRLLGKTDANALETEKLTEQAAAAYGIELVDIRLRRYNHPAQVREDIFQRIRSERNKKVEEYRSEGTRLAEDIRSAADRQAQDIRTEAKSKEQRLKGEADAEADRIRNLAQSKDVDFYVFLKKLEEYQNILGNNKTMLLLSSHRELFDLLFAPPKPANGKPREAPPLKAGDGRPRAN